MDSSELCTLAPGDHATFTPNTAHSTPDHPPAYRVISEADLQNLLSLAAAHLALGNEERKRRRTTQNTAVRHLGDQLCDPRLSLSPSQSTHTASPRWHPKRTRLRTAIRMLRRACAIQPRGVGLRGGADGLTTSHIDLESLRTSDSGDEDSDAEDSAWKDE